MRQHSKTFEGAYLRRSKPANVLSRDSLHVGNRQFGRLNLDNIPFVALKMDTQVNSLEYSPIAVQRGLSLYRGGGSTHLPTNATPS
jgi:hypothetical protein